MYGLLVAFVRKYAFFVALRANCFCMCFFYGKAGGSAYHWRKDGLFIGSEQSNFFAFTVIQVLRYDKGGNMNAEEKPGVLRHSLVLQTPTNKATKETAVVTLLILGQQNPTAKLMSQKNAEPVQISKYVFVAYHSTSSVVMGSELIAE